jgi:hypothetical protein
LVSRQKCWLFAYWSFMAVSTAHTCKKNWVHREFLILTCIKYTTHRILNIWQNHGGILNVFDRIGTSARWVHYYSTQFLYPDSYNLFVILTHEYKNIWDDMRKSDKWYDKFMYVLGLPFGAMTEVLYHKANTIWNGNSWKWGKISRIAVLNSG